MITIDEFMETLRQVREAVGNVPIAMTCALDDTMPIGGVGAIQTPMGPVVSVIAERATPSIEEKMRRQGAKMEYVRVKCDCVVCKAAEQLKAEGATVTSPFGWTRSVPHV